MILFSSLVANQIRFLLLSLNESNSDSVIRELCQFVEFGCEGSILLLQTCFYHIYFQEGEVQNVQLKHNLLAGIFRYLLQYPNFSSVLCEALKKMSMSIQDILDFELQLSLSEKVGIGLALMDSENADIRINGQKFCTSQIFELLKNSAIIESAEQIQNVIMFLNRSEGLSMYKDSFMEMLYLMEPKETTPFILAPFLSNDEVEARNMDLFYGCEINEFDAILPEMMSETDMASIMSELGYGCTADVFHCNKVLSFLLPLSEATLSRIVGTIARTHTGLEDNQFFCSSFYSAVGSSATCESSRLRSWNVDVLVDSIKQLAPDINWIHVMENLDYEGFYFPSGQAFSLFMSIYLRASQDPFPLHALCSYVWKNVDGQISFLRYAVSSPPDVFTFAHSSRKLGCANALSANVVPYGVTNHAWLSLDLLEVLCQLAERGHAKSVRQILESPLKQCPKILLLGIAQINTPYNLLQYEVFSAVFPIIVGDVTGSDIILQLWQSNPTLVLQGFLNMLKTDQGNMVTVLDICQELKILSSVLKQIPIYFSICLAVVATQKECINFERWFSDNIRTHKVQFLEACLEFLKEIPFTPETLSESSQQHACALANLNDTRSSTILKALDANAAHITSEKLSEELKRLCKASIDIGLRLQNVRNSGSAILAEYSDDIQEEAKSYLSELFSGQMTCDAMIELLTRFRELYESREQLIFYRVMRNPFEERRSFSQYPTPQLNTASILVDSLIKHSLVTDLTLGIAIHTVLVELPKAPDTKIFALGTLALQQFLECLVDFPNLCNHILQKSHLRGTHPKLVAFIERALARKSSTRLESNGGSASAAFCSGSTPSTLGTMELLGSTTSQLGQQFSSSISLPQRQQVFLCERHKTSGSSGIYSKLLLPPGKSSDASSSDIPNPQKLLPTLNGSSDLPSVTSAFVHASKSSTSSTVTQNSHSMGFGSALNIETLVAAAERRDNSIESPTSSIRDKIIFVVNNLSFSNTEAKAKEFLEILSEQHYPWFAQYIVMKRASIEPNFHDQYLKFLDEVNSKALNKEIIKAAYENCKVLLRSELIKSSSEDRSLLKNLGSWLGKLTIGRNNVLRALYLDPKSLIIEAYEKGLMIAVIPFTSKILEPCQNSLAYQPPNPWTMGILSLLAEIFVLPNLKMNLKFNIEVLFKNLGVEMKDVKPMYLLKDRVRETQGNPDFSSKNRRASQPHPLTETNTGVMSTFNPVELQPEIISTQRSSQYTGNPPSGPSMDDIKMPTLSLSDQFPSGLGISQVPSTGSQYSVVQLSSPTHVIRSDIIFNQNLIPLGLQCFQRNVTLAIGRAIEEVMDHVGQCSVTIATQTTKDLVLKDYAMESDETHIYKAAHLMVTSLAGGLAHVRCKDSLRVSILRQLRNSLQASNISSELQEQAAAIILNDNLDLCCAVIEHATMDKALKAINIEITQQLSLRRKHREVVGQSYYNASLYTQGPMSVIPEALRPRPGHLSYSQLRAYEEFVQFPCKKLSGPGSIAVPAAVPLSSTDSCGRGPGVPSTYVSSTGQLNLGLSLSGIGSLGMNSVTQPVDFISREAGPSSTGLHGSFSACNVTTDGIIPRRIDVNNVASISSPATVPDPRILRTFDAMEEVGVARPLLLATSTRERMGGGISESLTTADALEKYQVIAQKLETLLTKDTRETEIQGLVAQFPEIILRCISRDESALAVAQKVFKNLYENASNSSRVKADIEILAAIRDICKLVVKEFTSWVIYSDEKRTFKPDIVVGLIRKDLLNLAEYDLHMAKLIDAGRNKAATEFAISLLQILLAEGMRGVVSELPNLVSVLEKGSDNATPMREELINADPGEADLSGFNDQVSELFAEWYSVYESHSPNDAACSRFVSQLQQNGYLNGGDMTDRFFRQLTILSVTHCLSTERNNSRSSLLQPPQTSQDLSFLAIDVYAKLVVLILKDYMAWHGSNKLLLWPKILSLTASVLQSDAEQKTSSFNPRPYFRLFINWILDLVAPDTILEGSSFQILIAFADAFHVLQPLKVPAFSFAWLELISHKSFMPKFLSLNPAKGWPLFQRLLVDLFKFMEPHLREAKLGKAIRFLYKGTLRVFLVLLHDFPEFLSDYHFSFCDVIPPICIQMRNVILSACPRSMRLPDPFTPNLKIDFLPEMKIPPRNLLEVESSLKAKHMKSDVDEYLKTRRHQGSFLSELVQRLILTPSEASQTGTRYNVPLMNSLVLYVGMQTVKLVQANTSHPLAQQTNHTDLRKYLWGPAFDIFQMLIVDLDSEGRYLFLNSVANQLRYPNSLTHFFAMVILDLFAEADQEIIQDQIARILLERLIVGRSPWGLVVTFMELIKNPKYNFWSLSSIRRAPDIERLVKSVSRWCVGSKSVDEYGIRWHSQC